MLITGVINGSILVLLILIPLIYPEALPRAAMPTVFTLLRRPHRLHRLRRRLRCT